MKYKDNKIYDKDFMLMGPTKPRKPHKNQKEANEWLNSWGTKRDWPCYGCDAYGFNYDPRDRDVYEGYKMANRRVKCKICGGSGDMGKKKFKEWYRLKLQAYRERLSIWKDQRDMAVTALNKCSDQEKEALTQWELHKIYKGK